MSQEDVDRFVSDVGLKNFLPKSPAPIRRNSTPENPDEPDIVILPTPTTTTGQASRKRRRESQQDVTPPPPHRLKVRADLLDNRQLL